MLDAGGAGSVILVVKPEQNHTVGEPRSPTDIAMERIRLFFPLPDEERIALALTSFLGPRAGARIVDLRPDMRMGEVLDLARDHLWTTPEFGRMLELAGIEAFDDQFEQMTFREFVRYSASRKSESAQQNRCPGGNAGLAS